MIKNVEITLVVAVIKVPHIKSTTVTISGHPFNVAMFVKSYVPYITKPIKAPKYKAFIKLCCATAGLITKTKRATIYER